MYARVTNAQVRPGKMDELVTGSDPTLPTVYL